MDKLTVDTRLLAFCMVRNLKTAFAWLPSAADVFRKLYFFSIEMCSVSIKDVTILFCFNVVLSRV